MLAVELFENLQESELLNASSDEPFSSLFSFFGLIYSFRLPVCWFFVELLDDVLGELDDAEFTPDLDKFPTSFLSRGSAGIIVKFLCF
jgi:hypothetical protein